MIAALSILLSILRGQTLKQQGGRARQGRSGEMLVEPSRGIKGARPQIYTPTTTVDWQTSADCHCYRVYGNWRLFDSPPQAECGRGAVDSRGAGSHLRIRYGRATSGSHPSAFARLTDVRRRGPGTVSERGRSGSDWTISTAVKMSPTRKIAASDLSGAGCLHGGGPASSSGADAEAWN